MPKTGQKRNSAEVLRNLRIVHLHREMGYSFGKIAALPDMPSRQQCASIYTSWQDIPFEFTESGAIITKS